MGDVGIRAAIAAAERRLDELESSGAAAAELERFLVDLFVARNRSIRNVDFRRLDPSTVDLLQQGLRPRFPPSHRSRTKSILPETSKEPIRREISTSRAKSGVAAAADSAASQWKKP